MGNIFSSRGRQSTIEVLESIERELSMLQRQKRHTETTQKRAVGYIVFFLIVGLLILSLASYIYRFPSNAREAIINLWPLAAFPLIVWTLKYGVQSYFTWSMARIDERVADLKQERSDILSSVKETETYKDAMEILQRFDPTERRRKWEAEERARQEEERRRARSRERELAAEAARRREAQSEQLRRRRTMIPADVQRQPSPADRVPLPTQVPAIVLQQSTPRAEEKSVTPAGTEPVQPPLIARPSPAPTPRFVDVPIPPSERSTVDKIVDYLLGEGPANRYALICAQCHSHNGMALPSDYEYIAFRCPYCHHFNPARKQRPSRPPGEQKTTGAPKDEKNDAEDTAKEAEERRDNTDQELPQSEKATNDSVNNDESVVPDPVQSTA